ncbi:MAG: CBS domain-containing protein [Candidatus Aenigmatarchaeota archaeon]
MAVDKIYLSDFVDVEKPITEISSKRLVVASEKNRLTDILNLIFSEKVRRIPIIDNEKNLRGIVTTTDILNLLGGGEKYEIFKKYRESMEIRAEDFMNKHVKVIHFKTNIKKALEAFKRERSGFYPLLENKKIISVVTEWDFVKLIRRPTGIKVYEAMVERPVFVQRNYNIFEVAKMMCRGGFRRLPVVEGNILLGIVTPIDILSYLRSNPNKKLVENRTRIENIMERNVVTIKPDVDLFKAISIMKTQKIGGLPVVDEDELIGIVTERDVVDALI